MDAGQLSAYRRYLVGIAFVLAAITSIDTDAATVRTANFVVTAPTQDFAEQVSEAAEEYRRELAIEWTGKEMPDWASPCPVNVKVGENLGAGGSTTFNFDRGEVYGWRMNIEGSAERILDSVLPHEINHTIFACYFRRPLPRWADEGAASFIENESERMRLQKIAIQAVGNSKKIPLKTLVAMKDYPSDRQQVLTMYGEGYTLASLLLQRADKRTYLNFLQLAHEKNWETAFKKYYGYNSLTELESTWDAWMIAGCPTFPPSGQSLAKTDTAATPKSLVANSSPGNSSGLSANVIPPTVRGQNPVKFSDKESVSASMVLAGDRPINAGAETSTASVVKTSPMFSKNLPVKRRDQLEHPLILIPHADAPFR